MGCLACSDQRFTARCGYVCSLYLLIQRRLVLEVALDFFQIDFELFLGCLEILLLLLHIGLATMHNFL